MNDKQSFLGKRILFISYNFYEYPQYIIEKLNQFGATVKWVDVSAGIQNRLAQIAFTKHNDGYFSKVIEEIKSDHFDAMLYISMRGVPEWFFERVRELFPNIPQILYSWDAIRNNKTCVDRLKYFDHIISFDPFDMELRSDIRIVPLFYCNTDTEDRQGNGYLYKAAFVGYAHSERYAYVQNIRKQIEEFGYSCNIKLFLPNWLYYLRGKYIQKNLSGSKRSDFVYKKFSQKQVQRIFDNSEIILDMQLAGQTGLTMRTIETLGLKKKLITTNEEIKKYDFYNDNNILIVDRINPIIPRSFIEKGYSDVPKEVYERYSLDFWVQQVFRDVL